MKATSSAYEHEKSIERITEVLNTSDNSFEEKKSIPSRESLTYKNGFYVFCSALFVDIRGSKALTDKHTRPVLAKIYKVYISELIAVLRDHDRVHEISIEGDSVWGIFNTPSKTDIDKLFSVAAMVSSLIDTLNIKLKKKGYSPLDVGVGLSYGRSLLIKSGYKGSNINDVVWLGKLVGEAAQLCSFGNREYYDKEIMVSNVFYNNLNKSNQALLVKNSYRDCYHGDVINTAMNKWVIDNG